MSTSEQSDATSPADAPVPMWPGVPELIGVEVSTLDQHGDPGHVMTRGDFYSRSAAATFSLTQAGLISVTREVYRLAITVSSLGTSHYAQEGHVVGTAGELACAFADLDGYADGVSRVRFPAPASVVDAMVDSASVARPLACPDAGDFDGCLDVEILTHRPHPLPRSRSMVGSFTATDARRVAAMIAHRLGGVAVVSITQSSVVVTHSTTVSDVDAAAVKRYVRITRLRANLGALDPHVDAAQIEALTAELDALRRRAYLDGSDN